MSMRNPEFLEAADRIGRRLCRDAVWHNGKCNWLGWSMEPMGGTWSPGYRSFAADMYSGTGGIALFLARLWRYTGEAQQKKALLGAVNHVLWMIDSGRTQAHIGFYGGLTGIAWALLEAGTLLDSAALVERGLREIGGVAELEPDDTLLDVIGGSAGAIPALIDIAKRYNKPELMETVHRHAAHLLATADKAYEGWSWNTMPATPGKANLTGHSHGVAGVVTALLEAYRACGDEEFKQAAMEGLRYERRHFSSKNANWPDFRDFGQASAETSYSVAWCHGAPGIGLSRLRCFELLNRPDAILREIETAMSTTAQNLAYPVVPGQGNYSLCHGACGNAELLLLASDILDRPELRTTAEQVGLNGWEQIERRNNPWPCGVANAGETPNLLLGTAGIGYYYLRLYDSIEVPSVLVLRP